jgi:hypothetical protein
MICLLSLHKWFNKHRQHWGPNGSGCSRCHSVVELSAGPQGATRRQSVSSDTGSIRHPGGCGIFTPNNQKYHLVIWHSHGKSLINGGFNGKFIYKFTANKWRFSQRTSNMSNIFKYQLVMQLWASHRKGPTGHSAPFLSQMWAECRNMMEHVVDDCVWLVLIFCSMVLHVSSIDDEVSCNSWFRLRSSLGRLGWIQIGLWFDGVK